MTTLILLCLALLGVGVLLFVPQVRAQIVGGLSLKLFCFVLVGVSTLIPVSQARAELVHVCAKTNALIPQVDIFSNGGQDLRWVKPKDGDSVHQPWLSVVEDYLDKGFQLIGTDTDLFRQPSHYCLLLYKKPTE